MAKYHIGDNGMPGICKAGSADSCPKTQAGDSFHGTLEEASQESQRRFEEELGAFVTTSRAEEEKTAEAEAFAKRFADAANAVIADPTISNEGKLQDLRNELDREIRAGRGTAIIDSKTYEEAEVALSEAKSKELGGEVYYHPQGKVIRINADGSVQAFKDGKELSTSATAEKLRAGYGQWKRGDATGLKLPGAPKAGVSPEEEDRLVEEFDSKMAKLKGTEKRLQAEHAALRDEARAYDSAHAAAEGRAYYYKGATRIEGINPDGRTSFVESDAQKSTRIALHEGILAAREAQAQAQTDLENAGLGHRIPDAPIEPGKYRSNGHTIRVNNQAQKWLLEDELKGQISDGKWENTSGNPWEDWTSATVIVDPRNVGRNFRTSKDNYQLNAQDLLDVVGDRMVENVQNKTGNADYDEKAMAKDLKDLRNIFKTQRPRVSGD